MEIESCMDDVMLSRGRSTNQWAATVRQKIVEIENSQYQYVPMFATANVNQVNIENTIYIFDTKKFQKQICIDFF